MARDAETIQREIERARDALAVTVDELTTRANPRRVIEQGQQSAKALLSNPKVKYPLIGLGALVVLVLVRQLFR